ncbi:hypothetical protein AKJ09_08167 [Labilithrix luteola]|uniref:Uncharacterized protein n=1 Tax=Labilithrix luteola TaxID=1391654 RepID=A0A0K1Q707_9BACT|nr:hypothetical protein AKJ09_08167 [Labilithrix luteola]
MPRERQYAKAKYVDPEAAKLACGFSFLELLANEVAIAGVAATAVGTWLGSVKTDRAKRTALLGLPLLGYLALRFVGMAKALLPLPHCLWASAFRRGSRLFFVTSRCRWIPGILPAASASRARSTRRERQLES